MTATFSNASAVMGRALELAAQGVGMVEPNPPVGAVIVDDCFNLLGEGYHQKYGEAHAEVFAIQQAGTNARGGTLFVTLEPCSHQGKTAPCAEAVINAGIKKVVIAMQDPNERVNGSGIERLKAAGIEVQVGLMNTEATALLAPFIKLHQTGFPFVHAKWAMTLDGKIAAGTGHSQWISNEQSRAVVHQIRGRMDAILVGIGTAIADNPALTARPEGSRVATRIVLDSQARLPLDSQLVKTASEIPLLIATAGSIPAERKQAFEQLGVEVWTPSTTNANGKVPLEELLKELGRQKMTNLLVEGGGDVLGSFFDANLIDEVHAFIAPKIIGGQAAFNPIGGDGLNKIPAVNNLDVLETKTLAGDFYIRGRINNLNT